MPRGIYTRKSNPEKRFWRQVNKSETCWNWTGSLGTRGYGALLVDGATLLAHRYSYTLHVGPIPEGMIVRHSCDNPRCVNPDHLLLGIQMDNHADKIERGRFVSGWIKHRESMLRNLQCRERVNGIFPATGDSTRSEIVRMFTTEGLAQAAIGRQVGVSQNMVSKVIRDAGIRVPSMGVNRTPAERVAMIHEFNPEKAA